MSDMHRSLQEFLQPSSLEATLFPPTSRYHGVPVKTMTRANGRTIAYLARRFVPQQDQFETLFEHSVVEGDRIDNLAAQYVNDPEQYWRICDANNELDSQQLTAEAGRRIRITLPEGLPGAFTNA